MARKFTDRAAFDGETLTGTFTAPPETTALVVKLADGSKTAEVAATKTAGGTWTATATAAVLAGFAGATRWIALASTPDGAEAVAEGEIYIRPIVSKHRAVVAAIEAAVENYGKNANRSISVGEVSITYKTYDELLALLNYWRGRAAADERGVKPRAGGIRLIRTEFCHV